MTANDGHPGESGRPKRERRDIFVNGFIAGWWACSMLVGLMWALGWVELT